MAERAVNRDVDAVGLGAVAVLRLEESVGDLLRGWAESDEPGHPAALGAFVGDDLVALAVADKYDAHAFAEARGFGWIGFRLDLGAVPDLEPGARVDILCLKTRQHLHTHAMGNVRRRRRVRRTVHELVTEGSEDQVNFEVEQISLFLRPYERDERHLDLVSIAYRSFLAREGDESGVISYCKRLQNELTPSGLLKEILQSSEYKALKKRPFPVPHRSRFPF